MQPQPGISYARPTFRRTWLLAICETERSRLVLWLPVFMGAGVLAYYSLRFEPPVWIGPAITVPTIGLAILARGRICVHVWLLPVAAPALVWRAGKIATQCGPPREAGLPNRATFVTGVGRGVERLRDG